MTDFWAADPVVGQAEASTADAAPANFWQGDPVVADSGITAGNLGRAAIRGVPGIGGLYESNMSPEDRATAQSFDAANPWTSGLAKLAGGTLATGAAIAAAPELGAAMGLGGGALLPNIARGVASGAALGAGDAATRGQDPVAGAVAGGLGGSAGVVGGRVLGKAIDAFTSPKATSPSLAALKSAADTGAQAVRDSNSTVSATAVGDVARGIQQDLESNSSLPKGIFADKTHAVLDKMQEAPPGGVVSIGDVWNMRQMLGKAAGSPDPQDRLAASTAMDGLDQWLANIPKNAIMSGDPQATASTLADTIGNWRAYKQASDFNFKGIKAENNAGAAHSGLNIENTLRQQAKQILNNPRQAAQLDPDTHAAFQQFVRGSTASNVVRYVANVLSGGGGVATAGEAVIGHMLAGPVGAVAAPAAGLGIKLAANANARSSFNALGSRLRAASPLGRSLPQPAPLLTEQQRLLLRQQLGNATRGMAAFPWSNPGR